MRASLGPVFALITGGGTGGHVYPALALADALVARGHPTDTIRFVGAARGLEARAVPAAGYSIDLLPARGLQRGRSLRTFVANVRMLGAMAVAVAGAARLVRALRPEVVVSVGGYASVPVVLAARWRRVPVVVHEQNARPGLANRLAVRLGARPAVSLPGTALRDAVVIGNPVRAEVLGIVRDPSAACALVGVVGGSLGSARLNDAALGLYDRWRDRADRRVHHVTGPRRFEACARSLEARRRPDDRLAYELVAYEEQMDRLYAEATLCVCRAGAVTVAELAAAGVPSVLVPWPGAADDHQSANAAAMAAAGAAIVLPDADCTGEGLAAVADALLDDADRLAAMTAAARSVARPDAADQLASLVEEVAGARA